MEEAMEMARAKDTKQRMAGVERLHHLLEVSNKGLSPAETTALVDCCLDLLKGNSNFRVSQGALQVLSAAAVLASEHFKLHFNALVPAAVERLGDSKQPVRDAARRLLLTLMEVSSPTIIVERSGSYAWSHKSWRVREEFVRTMTSAIGLFASTELPLQRVLLPPLLQLLNDSNHGVREAAMLCIEEMYAHIGSQFCDELQRYQLSNILMREINMRLEKIEPKVGPASGFGGQLVPLDLKSSCLSSHNHKKNWPKSSSSSRQMSFPGGDKDITEKLVDPVKVYSEKELVREVEKVVATLVPERDWSIRIAAMQRLEGLVFGGALEYPCFPTLLKQLVPPLSTQLSDRRSSIVKQACHLLSFLSKELLGDFEACAEMYIPVLFKLVVITVLVIAESADNCIKTMLRNCKVARVLPHIAECAKNDRSAVLRARCCEYALVILECWADAPEIQRSAVIYEGIIRCCVGDAMSEVRSTARTCYRIFVKTWPERSKHLFMSFEPIIQRLINEEEGSMHRRYASPSLHERSSQLPRSQPLAPSLVHDYGISSIVAMDKGANLQSGASATSISGVSVLSDSLLVAHTKQVGQSAERSLESVLHSSKQKVTAIESMLKGLNLSEKANLSSTRSSSLDLGVDLPSTRDPPSPPAVADDLSLPSSVLSDSSASTFVRGSTYATGHSILTNLDSCTLTTKDHGQMSYFGNELTTNLPMSCSTNKYCERLHEKAVDENVKSCSRFPNMHIDRSYLDTPYKDAGIREPQVNSVPHFRRPLLRKKLPGRTSAGSRNSFEDDQLYSGEKPHRVDSSASLSDALSEGLNSTSDWSARVSAFNFLQNLLQQGPKGVQQLMQNFEKIMKLFCQHLDDPHHKVAQAALSALAELIPVCRKPFESYLERILPHVFSRLIDPKELVRQPSSLILEVVSKTYSIDSLLAALLRSLDEQRSPKAKLAVIEFAVSSFSKHALNSEGTANYGLLKLWLSKLTPLARDKNTKLKDAAITCIVYIYSHFDSVTVLNFILSLPMEGQNSLRRMLKQKTPRIEVDLMNFLQYKKERQRTKSSYDQSENFGSSSEESYAVTFKQNHVLGRYASGSTDTDEGILDSTQETSLVGGFSGQTASYEKGHFLYENFDSRSNSEVNLNGTNHNLVDSSVDYTRSWIVPAENLDHVLENISNSPCSHLDVNGFQNDQKQGLTMDSENLTSVDVDQTKFSAVKAYTYLEVGVSVPQLLHKLSSGDNESSSPNRHGALEELAKVSVANDGFVWSKYFNQILTAALEVLDDPEPSIREIALSLILEMLSHQKNGMEDSIEIIIQKLLHATEDETAKVSSEANNCLSLTLSQYDPYRCLAVIAPLLVSEDEKTLVTCINCLTKLVGRLSQEELMSKLPSFLPALFDAFGSQSTDVRKTVVFCLVDIYILLGKAFQPYLERLSSSQLRLVTIYANRISQARSGTKIDDNDG